MNKNLRFLLLSIIFVVISIGSAQAAYLQNVPQTITQPNGIVVHCLATGDEYYHRVHDSSGYTIVQDTLGWYVYAIRNGDTLAPTNLKVGINPPTSLSPNTLPSKTWLAAKYAEMGQFYNQKKKNSNSLQANPTYTNINNLVVFVKWANTAGFTNNIQHYEGHYNTNPYSLKNYYDEISYGQLEANTSFYPQQSPAGSIIYVTVSHNRNYYCVYNAATNPTGYSGSTQRTLREGELIAEIIDSINANNMVATNLDIDNNNDGYIDCMTFNFQGASEGWSDLIWPHQATGYSAWTIYNSSLGLTWANFTINGKKLNRFMFMLDEHSGISSTSKHEFGHVLGVGDFYYYDNQNGELPVYRWSIMSHNYGNGQYMTMFEREEYGGWVDVPQITANGTYTLNPVTASTNNVYKIQTLNSAVQYIYLEYRKPATEFSGELSNVVSPNSGLLVYRVDTRYWGSNDGGYEVYVYRPNGTYGNGYGAYVNGTTSGALRKQTNNPNLTSAQLFLQNGTQSGVAISDVTENANGTITFTVTIGNAYTITYNLNGGSGTMTPTTYSSATLPVTLPIPTRAGYTFGGWYANSGLTGTAITTLPVGSTGNKVYYAKWTTTPTYTITYNLNGGSGTMTPTTYTSATLPVTLPIPTRAGYTFDGWYENSGLTGTAITTIPIGSTGNKTYWAKWTITTIYVITYNLNGGSGTMTPTTYSSATLPVTLPIPTRAGYIFDGWYENSGLTGTAITTLPMGSTGNKVYYAKWSNTITVSANPANSGTASGAGTFANGSTQTVTATSNIGYHFVNWTEASTEVATTPNYEFVLLANRNLVANFAIDSYVITYNLNGGSGTMTPTTYTSAILPATLPIPTRSGYIFNGWYDNSGLAGSAVSTIQLGSTGDKEFWAKWDTIRFVITASAGANGTITPSGMQVVDYGQNISFAFTPNAGYELDVLTVDAAVVADATGNYSFSNVTQNHSINITFKKIPPSKVSLSLQANPTYAGNVAGGGIYDSGFVVQISAVANAGFHFVNWTESGVNIGNSTDLSVKMGGNRTLTANFEQNAIPNYHITTSVTPANTGTAEGSGQYDSGSVCTLIATANSDYKFVGWLRGSQQVSGNAMYAFTVRADDEYVAKFEAIPKETPQYIVTATANPSEAGTVQLSDKYVDSGSTCTANTTANADYKFVNWTENGIAIYANNPYSFVVTKDINLVANFEFVDTTKYVASIQLSLQTLELLAGGVDATLEYTISPADATNKNVSWKSTNPSIATVSDGVVTPIAVGET
ncbi:MAG: InlB B-repeat-containing protein, partial [Ignavibacteria bacterium]|nr:InlB B-repeat-containing protein [Ignavibacteria bacterium]